MNTEFNKTLNKVVVRQSFNQAATSYDKVAVLQRQVGQALLNRLEVVKRPFHDILDIGVGTGYSLPQLAKCYKNANLYALDMAEAMLQHTRQRSLGWSNWGWTDRGWSNWGWTNRGWQRWFGNGVQLICADMEQLPLADASVDMIYSNLTLQWCGDIHRTFAEWMRVLKPGGLLSFSSLGPDTLKELKHSWYLADPKSVHVHDFIDMHHVGDSLVAARFADPVLDVDYYTLTYQDVFSLMRELKALGAHNASAAKTKTLTGKSRLVAMQTAYENYRVDGLLPATYEVVFGHAWKAEVKPRQVQITLS